MRHRSNAVTPFSSSTSLLRPVAVLLDRDEVDVEPRDVDAEYRRHDRRRRLGLRRTGGFWNAGRGPSRPYTRKCHRVVTSP
jgi:hypothetical protein